MKTSLSIILLTVAFLSAGAFAQTESVSPSHRIHMSVVFKNQAWPVKGQISVDACKINRCTDI